MKLVPRVLHTTVTTVTALTTRTFVEQIDEGLMSESQRKVVNDDVGLIALLGKYGTTVE